MQLELLTVEQGKLSSSQGAYLAETMNLGAEIKSIRDRQGTFMTNSKDVVDLTALK